MVFKSKVLEDEELYSPMSSRKEHKLSDKKKKKKRFFKPADDPSGLLYEVQCFPWHPPY